MLWLKIGLSVRYLSFRCLKICFGNSTFILLGSVAFALSLFNPILFAQIPSDTTLSFQIARRPNAGLMIVVSNTQADVLYELQYKQSRTNWLSLGFNYGSELTNFTFFGFSTNSVVTNTDFTDSKRIRIRSWAQTCSDGIPDWWQMRYFGDVCADSYANPTGDGYSNQQKFQKGMDPFKWYPPAEPQVNVTFKNGSDPQHANAVLTWECDAGAAKFFLVERANQISRGVTFKVPPRAHPIVSTFNGKTHTNWLSLADLYRSPVFQVKNLTVTGSYQIIARVMTQAGIAQYNYVDTNLDAVPPPAYRILVPYVQPLPFAKLSEVTEASITNTVLPVSVKQLSGGYELTVLHPITHARYLLLVRDKTDSQWRASGYFVSGTNRNPVHLHVDNKGMMTEQQSPIALPMVERKFLRDVVDPEFTAGWGEDSDGDCLPDIYEVLVTHTDPGDSDTGDVGVQDGYRVSAGDAWNNWNKFRYRVNPFQKCEPHPSVVLKQPTITEMMEIEKPTSDLPFMARLEIRPDGAAEFHRYQVSDEKYLSRNENEHSRCDVRISWKVPPPNP
jgi:hypothetical protein